MRRAFRDELQQLSLQIELMGARVDQNLVRMSALLVDGDAGAAAAAVAADDEIDDMSVSLTERCYDLLARENPVASDLRLVVSALRILGELERIGDLSLRVVKLEPQLPDLRRHDDTFATLVAMSATALDAYRTALAAWAAQNQDALGALEARVADMDRHYEQLMAQLLALTGPDAVAVATGTLIGGRALERIVDHAVIVGARLRYLVTGDTVHLSEEVR